MAKQKKVLGKLGAKLNKAVAEHRDDPVDYGFGTPLPEGIDGGVAQLTSCKFGVYKTGNYAGEPFFMASGRVKRPKEVDGVSVEGLITQIGPEPVCDTPDKQGNNARKTFSDHIGWVMNELRKLGVETEGMDGDELEDVVSALQEAKPHFRFRTWKGQKQTTGPYANQEPRVQQTWLGACEYNGEVEEDVVDSTEEVDEEDETPEPEAQEADSEEETEETSVADLDLVALGEAADEGDEEAQERLDTESRNLGIDPDGYPTWAEVAQAIGDSRGEPVESEADKEEEDSPPSKGESYMYRPRGSKSDVECEVTAVFSGKQVCNLKAVETGKIYKSVPWGSLKS